MVFRRRVRRYSRRRTSTGYATAARAGRLQPRLVRSAPLRAVHFRSPPVSMTPQLAAVSGGVGVLLNAVDRGNSIEHRTGNRIRMMSLIINGGLYFNPFRSSAATQMPNGGLADLMWERAQECQILVFFLPGSVTSIPPLTDYFQPGQSGVVDTWSLPRVTDTPTMRLIFRKSYQLACLPNGNTDANQFLWSVPSRTIPIRFKINLGQLVQYANVTETANIGQIMSGALVLYVLGDYPGTTSPAFYQCPVFQYETRLAFTNVD